MAEPRVNRQHRFAMLVQVGVVQADLSVRRVTLMHVLDMLFQIPEEHIPRDVGGAAAQCIEWIARASWPIPLPEDKAPPAWVTEWLEQENRPNPFESS